MVKLRLSLPEGFDIYETLDHPIRRLLLERLHSRPRSSFTELMKATGESTGSLSFHLSKLEPLLSQDEEKKYSLNQSGERVCSIIKQLTDFEPVQSPSQPPESQANITPEEKIILSSDKIRPLGDEHAIGGLTKSNVHHINATLTNRRLLLSGWRFFHPTEIKLTAVKLVRTKKDIPLTKGDLKGRSIEVTYADQSDRLRSVRFIPPDIEKWAKAIREACSEISTSEA